ncbi:MAG TPA: DUF3618 domain-containing protein [Anaerolineae bacterium]|nr:DUF3618 domain-containing protein [Anaerolineae bacterium]HRV93557.1 DUF3618 domain-containing protein [Anaerolineae bacterium]
MATASTQLNPIAKRFTYRETDDPQEIKAQIEATRTEMSQTIDAIQHKLSPDHLTHQLKQNIKDATKGKVEEMAYQVSDTAGNWRSGLVNTVRDNPIPSALIGLGIGWLLFNNNSTHRSEDDDYYPTYGDMGSEAYQSRYFDRAHYLDEETNRGGYIGEDVKDTAHRTKEQASDLAASARTGLANAAGQVKETVSHTVDSVGDLVNHAQEATVEYSGQLAETARDNTYYYSRRAKRTTKDLFYDNPLAAGAVALAAGAIVGMLAPNTQKENELMGPSRDQLVDQVQAKAQETVEKVQHVAEEAGRSAAETAKDEADKQGLPRP